jgi:putative ABC transport system permease protein
VVGTSGDLFEAEARRGVPIACAEGEPFRPFDEAAGNFEAVLGATVAAHEGLRPGSTLTAAHGLDERVEGEEHDEAPWTVTGVLAPTGTPLDRVVLVHWEATYAMEGHDATAGRGPDAERRISSVLVKSTNPILASSLFFQIRASETLTPARPFLEVRNLLDLVGNADRLLVAVSALVVVVAALGIMVSMVSGMRERRRDLAMMRALGAPRRVLAGLMVGEAATVGAIGAGAGLILGHGIVAAGATALTAWSGVRVRPLAFAPEEILFFAAAAGICALAGLVPAVAAYRTEVASGLSAEG